MKLRTFEVLMRSLTSLSLTIAMLLLLWMFAIISEWDYEEARMRECAVKGLSYHFTKDVCYAPTQKD